MKGQKFSIVLLVLLTSLILTPDLSGAKEEYAEKTGQECELCHADEPGGDLTDTGASFKASGYIWPITEGVSPILPLPKILRLIIGYLHLLTAFMWFGTILYVHLILKPQYASKGLPKGEVMVGFGSMVLIAVTGILLTLSRVSDPMIILNTRWGLQLTAKVALFLVMVSSALFAVLVIGPMLKRKSPRTNPTIPTDGIFGPLSLAVFDGMDGRQAFIAFDGNVYDVSRSERWGDGTHYKRHSAGTDLTDALKLAPHGSDKLEGFKLVGTYNAGLKAGNHESFEKRTFFFIAYMNLIIVFVIIFILALWEFSGM